MKRFTSTVEAFLNPLIQPEKQLRLPASNGYLPVFQKKSSGYGTTSELPQKRMAGRRPQNPCIL
jgi:hypothetical protein